MGKAVDPSKKWRTTQEALAEVALVLRVGSRESPLSVPSQAQAIARAFAYSDFARDTFAKTRRKRSWRAIDSPDILEQRYFQWVCGFIEQSQKTRKKKKTLQE